MVGAVVDIELLRPRPMVERHSLGCADRVEVLLHLLNPAIANEEEETDGSHRFRFKSNIGWARWSKLTEAGSCETFGTHSAPDHFPHQLMWDHQVGRKPDR